MSTYPDGYDPAIFPEPFSSAYHTHLQHLKLKALQPKTIDAYACAIHRMGDFFDFAIDNLSPGQLIHYFSDWIATDAPPPQLSEATTNQSYTRSQLEDRATVAQKHCACARPKTAQKVPQWHKAQRRRIA